MDKQTDTINSSTLLPMWSIKIRHFLIFHISASKTPPRKACATVIKLFDTGISYFCLQFFDTVGWAAGRASGL